MRESEKRERTRNERLEEGIDGHLISYFVSNVFFFANSERVRDVPKHAPDAVGELCGVAWRAEARKLVWRGREVLKGGSRHREKRNFLFDSREVRNAERASAGEKSKKNETSFRRVERQGRRNDLAREFQKAMFSLGVYTLLIKKKATVMIRNLNQKERVEKDLTVSLLFSPASLSLVLLSFLFPFKNSLGVQVLVSFSLSLFSWTRSLFFSLETLFLSCILFPKKKNGEARKKHGKRLKQKTSLFSSFFFSFFLFFLSS